jgi:uncharacterized protein YxjI
MAEATNLTPVDQPSIISATIPVMDNIFKHMDGVVYPLHLSFKLLSIAANVTVTDASGRIVVHINQKLFKLKNQVHIFSDLSREVKLAEIISDRVLDLSARYYITDASGQSIGSVGIDSLISIWKAHYEVFNSGDNNPVFLIREVNPLSRFIDRIFSEVPFLGLLSGYIFHPKYLAFKTDGTSVMRLTKLAAFIDQKYVIEKLDNMSPREELNLILSFFMLVVLERGRG